MWRFILAVSLLCWGSEGKVSCRNNDNNEVDWFVLYKAPSNIPHRNTYTTGLEYVYIDSSGEKNMNQNTPNYKSINHPAGVLSNTLRPIFTSIRSMPPNLGFISYSDQPPGSNADQKFGHSKGVVIVDSSDSGIWLLHSTPQFPFRRNQNEFWPASGNKFAQTFVCVTLDYNSFAQIGTHLQYIGAFPFEHDIPDHFHLQLREAVQWKTLPPSNNWQLLKPNFYSIAKQQSAQPRVGDLYVTIASLLRNPSYAQTLYVQTWGGRRNRDESYCSDNLQVLNVEEISTGVGRWKRSCDHSKWCVSRESDWTCIADVNRAYTQYERRGGAVCIQSRRLKTAFVWYVRGTEDCNAPVSTDEDPDCDTGGSTMIG